MEFMKLFPKDILHPGVLHYYVLPILKYNFK